ncbi:hypothetical protein MKW92_044398 [Papaver armeniacum]|nr:hypothetical protein MKW92_044398 [Papaver armeniacum]
MGNNQTWISSEKEQVRNWIELPHDVLSHIFLKLGAMGVLFNAQSVCSVWRKVSKEPFAVSFYRYFCRYAE